MRGKNERLKKLNPVQLSEAKARSNRAALVKQAKKDTEELKQKALRGKVSKSLICKMPRVAMVRELQARGVSIASPLNSTSSTDVHRIDHFF